MRRRLVFLMIALFLLRGWVGDAMAGQMLAHEVAASAQAAAGTPEPMVHGIDCPGAAEASGPSCDMCQACSAIAAQPVAGRCAPARLPQPVPAMDAVAFASAEALQGFKPPIS